MYQVFIVEDEMLIRHNLRKMVENLSGPFSFCGEAEDGEMALSILQDVMPDILLTDIRMPFLDGLELIRHAKAMMPWLKVAIISGFDDFEYARKAISLGVDSYLLKPLSAEELAREMQKMAEALEKERKTDTLPGIAREEMDAALRQHYMRRLLYGRLDTGTLLEKARALNLNIVSSFYRAALFCFDIGQNDREMLNAVVHRVLLGQEVRLFYQNNSERLTVLFYDNDEVQMNEKMYRFIAILRHEVHDVCPVVTVVASVPVQRLSGIADACHSAGDLLEKMRLVSTGQVIDATDTAQLTACHVDFDTPFGSEFNQRLRNCSADDIEGLLDSVLQGEKKDQFASVLMRYYALLGILRSVVQIICSATPSAESRDIAAKLNAEHDIINASGKMETFRDTALALLKKAVSTKQDNAMYRKHYYVISRAEEYVKENFCDPNITLISVADHVGMSAAHFSTLFSQTFGKPFIAYLTALRIGRAKELLLTSDKRLADIAMEVGYNEPNYFSHVFRKSEGMTPKEYRNAESSRQGKK